MKHIRNTRRPEKILRIAFTNSLIGTFQESVSVASSGNGFTATTSVPPNASVTLSVSVTLPNWTGRDKASPEQQKSWDNFVAGLKTHEEGHVKIAVDSFAEVNGAFHSAHSTGSGHTRSEAISRSRSGFGAALNSAWSAEMNKVQAKQDFYDVITIHGACETGCPWSTF